jgi:hypothetical protein
LQDLRMERKPMKMAIPDDLTFSDLKLSRDPKTGEVEFDWGPIERICAASGVDVELFKSGPEDNVSGLIVGWYRVHLEAGGAPDPVQEQLLREVAAEDAAVLVANPGAGGVH